MRIETNGFAKRPLETLKEKPKYFLIYEGSVTEPVYFSGIIANRNKLAIKETLSIISVLRSLDDISKSHPKYALLMAKDIKLQSLENCITKENMLKCIKDFVNKNNCDNNEYLIKTEPIPI